ncbi:MAG: bifunctional 5,10-methylene-tetrahydrofolate dehydrogenase/5,10-methylene-tetrahydrofolate cyclohydrolase [Bacteroidetes bacterium]|nr:bifunctional 5,10-methylene-tetrahydrofolate dehydrogenase/5,10-methylene-tetrahydrofolate cyclohydrolase [Bacteroidota bacterium]
MELLDGKFLAKAIKEELKEKIAGYKAQGWRAPHLCAILVGEDGASQTYVASKERDCKELGMDSTVLKFPAYISEDELLGEIEKVNINKNIDGLIVQMPVPEHISSLKVMNHIDPSKDVDGFHPMNVGMMFKGLDAFLPATPYGIMMMLERYKIETSGKHAVIIGRSDIVGKPMAALLMQNSNPGNCTVTVCHSRTKNLKELCLQADIIVAALGRPEFLKGDMVKEGAVVIDVGITRVDAENERGYVIKGDVAYDEVAPKSSYITPVPGGVGLMTRIGLLQNTLKAYEWHMKG